jgi:alanyl-tRNA synthetase
LKFLTRELGIDPEYLAVTVFAGDADAPRDEVSARVWRSLGIPNRRIFYLPKADNWWGPAGMHVREMDSERVNVYPIGNFSKEVCAGPHVNRTSELGHYPHFHQFYRPCGKSLRPPLRYGKILPALGRCQRG